MEMEMEAGAEFLAVDAMMERLQVAADALEQAVQRLAAVELQASGTRESELAQRLATAESTIATLRAQAASQSGRKTTVTATLAAKEGPALEAGTLDAALTTLSLEQRIAVKAQLMRSGLLG